MKVLKLALLFTLVCVLLCSCSILDRFNSSNDHPVEAPNNSFFAGKGEFQVGENGNQIIGDGSGIIAVIPGKDNGQENDTSEDKPTYPLEKELFYFKKLGAHEGFHEYGRLMTLNTKSDNTFTFTSEYFIKEFAYDMGWYCPGGETSGVDTPYWEGTYTWDGTNLLLDFKEKVSIIYADEEPTPIGVHREPINKTVKLVFVSENAQYMTFNSDPLPMLSPFETVDVGQINMYFNIKNSFEG